MKKLKKLTRMGLNELANEMPQVSEIQQQEYVGGNYYYYFDGTSCGKFGDGTYVVFFDPNVNPQTSGLAFGSAPLSAQEAVIWNKAAQEVIGLSGIAVGSFSHYDESTGILNVELPNEMTEENLDSAIWLACNM